MNEPTGVEAALCRDVADRQVKGIAKYGMTVAGNNLSLREWLQHAYEEMLDCSVYMRRAMDEIEKRDKHQSEYLIRPDAPGHYWRFRQSHPPDVVHAKMIWWNDDETQPKVLACTAGGAWFRCDHFGTEKSLMPGALFVRINPPKNPHE